ncbi:DUF3157 family protein [Litoribaculum gwangyangense]|uniref:DUF3157 family protein n=1 Tax=Litoribaculum gwangyangense TaxID=1130722 RepID=A0ABP9C493_9FLAO
MKTSFFILFFAITSFAFSQNNYIVNTEDGRRVLLKADFTWEYIDAQISTKTTEKVKETISCNLPSDFMEPELNQKIQSQLKKGRATIEHVKEKVAKDNNCTIDEVLLLSVSEQKSKATYTFCANGKEVKYKRVGNSIIKHQKLF